MNLMKLNISSFMTTNSIEIKIEQHNLISYKYIMTMDYINIILL